jgi:hypothetical protein
LNPYECVCGWWHLTSRPVVEPERMVEDPQVTAAVMGLSVEEFAVLVSAEVRGEASREQAAALRSRVLAGRWADALKGLQEDLGAQFAARAGDYSEAATGWRRRAAVVRSLVSARQAEVRRLRQGWHAEAAAEKARLAAEGTTVRSARAAAGERAARRLQAAHAAEFGRLLAEEFEAAGLVLPERVARHVVRNGVAL